MEEYKKMYHKLFWSIEDAIQELKKSLLEAEEIYISGKDNKTIWLKSIEEDKKSPQ